MKTVFFSLLLLSALTARAQFLPGAAGSSAPTAPAGAGTTPTPSVARAERLTAQMTRELRLNGFQTNRLRAINTDKAAKLDVAERQLAAQPARLDQQRQAIARERDQELQAVLSTDQYTDYFDARARYQQLDRDYARSASASLLINEVRNPTPVRDNNAVMGPAKTGKEARRSVPLGRTLRQ